MALLACIILTVMISGCAGQVEKDGLNNTTDRPWPKLFDVNNLPWYKYNMINGTTGMLERQLTITYDRGPGINLKNFSGDAPVKVTQTNMTWVNIDRRLYSRIYTSEADGSVTRLEFRSVINGTPYSIMGDPVRDVSWRVRSDAFDIEARFDEGMGRSLYVSGFDFISHNSSTYYCSVYKSYEDASFRAWHNATVPVPLKIVANICDSDDMNGLWTFELAGWG